MGKTVCMTGHIDPMLWIYATWALAFLVGASLATFINLWFPPKTV